MDFSYSVPVQHCPENSTCLSFLVLLGSFFPLRDTVKSVLILFPHAMACILFPGSYLGNVAMLSSFALHLSKVSYSLLSYIQCDESVHYCAWCFIHFKGWLNPVPIFIWSLFICLKDSITELGMGQGWSRNGDSQEERVKGRKRSCICLFTSQMAAAGQNWAIVKLGVLHFRPFAWVQSPKYLGYFPLHSQTHQPQTRLEPKQLWLQPVPRRDVGVAVSGFSN